MFVGHLLLDIEADSRGEKGTKGEKLGIYRIDIRSILITTLALEAARCLKSFKVQDYQVDITLFQINWGSNHPDALSTFLLLILFDFLLIRTFFIHFGDFELKDKHNH